MKHRASRIMLALLFSASAWSQQPNPVQISVDNQTTGSIFISRLGAPDQQVLIPKRIVRTVDLPLVGGGSESLEMLQVTFPNSTIVPETSFAGFNGRFAQRTGLTISASGDVRIHYSARTGSETASNAPNPLASEGSPASGNGYVGSGYSENAQGGGYRREVNDHNAKFGKTNSANFKDAAVVSPATTKHGERRRTAFAGATGVRVKVTSPAVDALITPPEPPAPLQTSNPVVAPGQRIPPAGSPSRSSALRSVLVWTCVAAGLFVFVIWRRMRSPERGRR